MRILITGASGQLGSALMETVPDYADVTAMTSQDCDFGEPAMLHARIIVEAPDLIINAAAYTQVDKAESEPEAAYEVNAEAVGVMVEALGETGGRLVQVSTDFVFDGEAHRPYGPEDAINPLGVYGKSKAAGEAHLRPQDLLVRTSWLYSEGGSNFVNTMLRLMGEGRELRVVSDQIGAPTHAQGLAQAIWQLIGKQASGKFHYSDEGALSWHEFALAIRDEALEAGLLEQSVPVHPIAAADYQAPAPRPAYSVLDCTKTRELIEETEADWRLRLRAMLRARALAA